MEKKSLAQQTAERLYSIIAAEGRFAPGEKLPNELALSRELGVSRATLREAIRTLAAQGALEVRRGKGTFVSQAVEEMSDFGFSTLERVRGQLRDLSIAVAEKVIHISLKSSGEVIARMIQAATEKLKRREWVHIYLADCDAKNLAQAAPELTTALAGLSDHIKFMPMADDEPGTCIIEMPDEIIDASAATQLSNIRDLLKDE